ncbi:MAG: calcium-binding protein [Planctomycetota bacterium]
MKYPHHQNGMIENLESRRLLANFSVADLAGTHAILGPGGPVFTEITIDASGNVTDGAYPFSNTGGIPITSGTFDIQPDGAVAADLFFSNPSFPDLGLTGRLDPSGSTLILSAPDPTAFPDTAPDNSYPTRITLTPDGNTADADSFDGAFIFTSEESYGSFDANDNIVLGGTGTDNFTGVTINSGNFSGPFAGSPSNFNQSSNFYSQSGFINLTDIDGTRNIPVQGNFSTDLSIFNGVYFDSGEPEVTTFTRALSGVTLADYDGDYEFISDGLRGTFTINNGSLTGTLLEQEFGTLPITGSINPSSNGFFTGSFSANVPGEGSITVSLAGSSTPNANVLSFTGDIPDEDEFDLYTAVKDEGVTAPPPPSFAVLDVPSTILTVTGTPDNDVLSIVFNNGDLRLRLNGEEQRFDPASVGRIELYMGAGDDLVDFSGIDINTYAFMDVGDDTVTAGAGRDTLTGAAGRDRLFGGPGDDRVNGNGTRDFLFGEGGNDRIYGGDANDYLDGGGNVDRLFGGDGDDFLTGASSNDKLQGEAGNDTLEGGKQNDLLSGGTGDDVIIGNAGLDTLRGDAGFDSIFALDGELDLIDGGTEDDEAEVDGGLDSVASIESLI